MYYTIYKITNTVNGKVYIGKHQTKNLDDGYIGSGKLLKAAIAKYGETVFEKEILFCLDSEQEMNEKEKELVTEEFCQRRDTYNLCVGGKGGFSYINTMLAEQMVEVRRANLAKNVSIETRRQNAIRTNKIRTSTGACFTREQNIENAKKAWTPEVRAKRKETRRRTKFQVGSNNSQFGTRWITDGKQNCKIKKNDTLPEGWVFGRI